MYTVEGLRFKVDNMTDWSCSCSVREDIKYKAQYSLIRRYSLIV